MIKAKRSKNYRKIWESFHNKKIPKGYHIHHKDGDRTNDAIENLLCVSPEEHQKLHEELGHKIVNGKFISIAGNRLGISRSLEDKQKISKAKTGILTVPKTKELNDKVAKSMGARSFKVTKDNHLIGIYFNLSAFCKEFNLNRRNVYSCLTKKYRHKTVSGYTFEYTEI